MKIFRMIQRFFINRKAAKIREFLRSNPEGAYFIGNDWDLCGGALKKTVGCEHCGGTLFYHIAGKFYHCFDCGKGHRE